MLETRRRGSVVLRIAVGVAVVATTAACGTSNPAADGAQVQRGLEAIAGIDQHGFTLGDPDAPWTLSVISSPTSFELDALITQLPALTERFVRPGRLNVQMRTPTKGPYGADGEERAVAGALLAAGLQDRYWDALVRFVPPYRGGVGTADLASLLRRAAVPDVSLAMTERSTHRIRAALDQADEVAAAAEGDGRLVYVLAKDAGEAQRLTFEEQRRTLADEVGGSLR